jgi:hypothetical protein
MYLAGTLAVRAAEMRAPIRCSLAEVFPRKTELAEPLTFNPEPWTPPSGFVRHWHGPSWISDPFGTLVAIDS